MTLWDRYAAAGSDACGPAVPAHRANSAEQDTEALWPRPSYAPRRLAAQPRPADSDPGHSAGLFHGLEVLQRAAAQAAHSPGVVANAQPRPPVGWKAQGLVAGATCIWQPRVWVQTGPPARSSGRM
jgi:hypothetical protein